MLSQLCDDLAAICIRVRIVVRGRHRAMKGQKVVDDRAVTLSSCLKQVTRLVDDVISSVYVEGFAGYETRRVVRQKRGGCADIVNRDEAACRRLRFCLVEQGVEFGDAR